MEDPERIGKYTIVGQLGAGGMGIVYSARDPELDRKVAIKLMRARELPDAEARLKREAQALAKLSHPHVVQVYEVGEHEGRVFLAMELVQGRTLRSWQLGDHTWRDVVTKYVAAGKGLVAAHVNGIIHRDFKPDNVLVGKDGRPRVLDFGLARPDRAPMPTPASTGAIEAGELTEAGTILGTPAYMAPEQLQGLDVDARCDQFAFCVSLFEALYGTRPFAGKTIAELEANVNRGIVARVDPSRRGVPLEVHAAIVAGLASDPNARHRDLDGLLRKLQRASRRRRLSPWIAGFATATVLTAATAYALWPEGDATTTAPDDDTSPDDPRAAILATSDLPAVVPAPLPHDPIGVSTHRLANGLTVFVVPRRDQPMVRIAFAVRLGAFDEPREEPGVHHIATHMLEAGSRRLGSRDPTREAELLRARDEQLATLASTDDPQQRLQAIVAADEHEREAAALTIGDERGAVLREAGAHVLHTDHDAGLVLSVEMPAPSLDLLLAVEADRMRDPSFRGFLAETNRLLAQARVELDGTHADADRAWELLAASLPSPAPPDRQAAFIATLPFAAMKAAFAERFVPNNVGIAIVGDVDAKAAVGAVEAAFGDWEPALLPAPPHPSVPIADGRVFATVIGSGGPRATIAFPLPPALTHDRRGALLLAHVLERAVPDPDGPLPSVDTLTAELRANVLVIAATPDAHAQLDDVEAEVVALLDAAASQHLDAERLARAIADRELALARLLTNELDIANAIALGYVERRAWKETALELSSPALGDAPLAVSARALLDHGRVVVFRSEGRYEPPAIPPLPITSIELPEGGRSAFAAELLARPRSRIEPQFLLDGRHYARRETEGMAVVTARTAPPLFRAGVRWPIGVGHDWWACDAITTRVADVEGALAQQGVDLDVECDRNATAVCIEGPPKRFDAAWSLLLPKLADPVLADDIVRAHADDVLARRRRARADPDRAFASLVEFATWEDGGGTEHAMPTDEAIERVSPSLLETSLRVLLETTPAVTYAGPDANAIEGKLPNTAVAEAPEPREWRARRPAEPLLLFADLPRGASAAVAVSIAAPPIEGPEVAVVYARLLQGRFVQRFRDAGGWARVDDVAHRKPAFGDASFVVRASVPHDHVADAIAMALALVRDEPTQEAFTAALRSVEESARADRVAPHRIPETVLSWSTTDDPRMTTWERLAHAELGEVQNYARAAAEGAPVIAIGAELGRLDLDALRELGTVTVVDVADLCK